MKKIWSTLFIAASLCTTAFCQHAITSSNWEILATKTYKLKNGRYSIYFPPELKALNNKVIDLPGFMIPIKAGTVHQEFMLSVLPIEQCPYCGQGDFPSMVQVKTDKPIAYVDHVITIKGKLILDETDNSPAEFRLLNAQLVSQ